MDGKAKRAALYLRVSTDGQTTENQRLALEAVAEQRGWTVTQVYEDVGLSGAKGRDKRPGFHAMMKEATQGSFDIVMVWAVDRLGRSTATAAPALAELGELGIGFYADREGMDATAVHKRALLQLAAVFAELERNMNRDRVNARIARAKSQRAVFGAPKVSPNVEADVRRHLSMGLGMNKIARALGITNGTVERIAREQLAPSNTLAAVGEARELLAEHADIGDQIARRRCATARRLDGPGDQDR